MGHVHKPIRIFKMKKLCTDYFTLHHKDPVFYTMYPEIGSDGHSRRWQKTWTHDKLSCHNDIQYDIWNPGKIDYCTYQWLCLWMKPGIFGRASLAQYDQQIKTDHSTPKLQIYFTEEFFTKNIRWAVWLKQYSLHLWTVLATYRSCRYDLVLVQRSSENARFSADLRGDLATPGHVGNYNDEPIQSLNLI